VADLADLSRIPCPPAPPRWRRYLQTVTHLRPEQMARLFARRVLARCLPERLPRVRSTPKVRPNWAPRAVFLDDPAASKFRPDLRSLQLLQIEKTFGDPVDWAPADMRLLWQLELNYFHWMPGDLPWPAARQWVIDWLDHAPRDLRSQCWNPFGVAQRIIRWTRLIRGPWWDEIRADPTFPRLLEELYSQCRFIARHQEKELLGNHLVKTVAALYAGGRFFAGTEADRWLRRAMHIFHGEVQSQILSDGGHYERSPMYHLFVLVDLIDTYNITPAGDPFAERLYRPIERMYRFAEVCTHGDGEIPLFNDSVFDQAPSRVDVLRYAERVLGLRPSDERPDFIALPDFGQFRLGDRRNCLWLDAGPTGPPFLQAHAHADTGSIELSVGPQRLVCDSGVYSYQEPLRRGWDRSTPAHSTLSIAGESTSDCWGSFRVARRARIRGLEWTAQEGKQGVKFRHDGFCHLPASPRHERDVTFRAGTYTIHDRVICSRAISLRCDGFLYLGPGVTVRPCEGPPESRDRSRTWSFELGCETAPHIYVRVTVSFPCTAGDCAVFVETAEFASCLHTNEPGHRIRAAGLAKTREFWIEWRLEIR
jgi:hypothetical protein